jgi:hypothetical protein
MNFHYFHIRPLVKLSSLQFYTLRPMLGQFPVNAKKSLILLYEKAKKFDFSNSG